MSTDLLKGISGGGGFEADTGRVNGGSGV